MPRDDCDFRTRLVAGVSQYELTGSHGERMLLGANVVLQLDAFPPGCCEGFRARAMRLFGPDAGKHRQLAAECAARGEDLVWDDLAYDGSTPIGDPRNTTPMGGQF